MSFQCPTKHKFLHTKLEEKSRKKITKSRRDKNFKASLYVICLQFQNQESKFNQTKSSNPNPIIVAILDREKMFLDYCFLRDCWREMWLKHDTMFELVFRVFLQLYTFICVHMCKIAFSFWGRLENVLLALWSLFLLFSMVSIEIGRGESAKYIYNIESFKVLLSWVHLVSITLTRVQICRFKKLAS